jgi:23S rRNA (uracil1939-C5)-methyltransferase
MSTPALQPGQLIPLRLDSLAVGGEAVGRYEGLAVFAMFGCPGDEAEVEITEVAERFARGVVRRVVTPSPDRVEPPCPHFRECGGCQWQHISYQAQLRHKTAMVRDAVSRIGGLSDVEIGEAWGMDNPWLYRGRAEYRAALGADGQVALGFTRHHSHDIVALRECRLQHPLSERVRTVLLSLLPRVAQTADERAALLKLETAVSFAGNRAVATLVCEGRPAFVLSAAEALMAEIPELVGVCAARQRGRGAVRRSPAELVAGNPYLTERLGQASYRVSPDSFFQVNPAQAARILSLVLEWAEIKPSDVIVDAYSGVGTFLLPLSRTAKAGVGIESDNAAISDARANLRQWRPFDKLRVAPGKLRDTPSGAEGRLSNVTLHRGRVDHVLPRLAERDLRPDVIVLDPPRKGCGAIVCAAAARLRPRRILLVSCHPATLARDLKSLAEHGYPARRLQPVDMFPQTWHVEAVAVCERV